MKFDELRKLLGGGAVKAGDGIVDSSCEVLSLSAHVLESLAGVRIVDTGFPGCFCFDVRVDEGHARYIGVVSIGLSPVKHSKGLLELYLPIGDYTAEREKWLSAVSVDQLKSLVGAKK
jgi:hypothetical protein